MIYLSDAENDDIDYAIRNAIIAEDELEIALKKEGRSKIVGHLFQIYHEKIWHITDSDYYWSGDWAYD